jgi:hypothetical protein
VSKGRKKAQAVNWPPKPPVVVLPPPDFARGETKDAWVARAQSEVDYVVRAYVDLVHAWQLTQSERHSEGEYDGGEGGGTGGGGGTVTW